uniref:Uncharacterized protein n=1 Tax=Globodera rostochiensis TaxID=31243 RepID=A0A914HG52_GLORO
MPAPHHLHHYHNYLLWLLTHLLCNLPTTLSHQKASRAFSDGFVKIDGATSHRRNKRYYGMLCDVSKFSGFLRPRVCPSPQSKGEEELSSERKLEEGEKEQLEEGEKEQIGEANLKLRGELAEQKEQKAQKERRAKKGKRVKWKEQEAIEDANERLKKRPKVKRRKKAKSQRKKNDEKLEKGDKTLTGKGWANVGERVRGVGGRAITFANPVARELAPRALRVAAPGVGAAIGTMALGPAGGMMGRAIGNKAADYLSGNYMQNSMPTSEAEKNRRKTVSNVADVAENLWNKRRERRNERTANEAPVQKG